MNQQQATKPRGRKARTLQEEITATAEKLRKLQERQKEIERKDRARNQKAVLKLIKAEKLDSIPIEQWRQSIESIKAALIPQSPPLPHQHERMS